MASVLKSCCCFVPSLFSNYIDQPIRKMQHVNDTKLRLQVMCADRAQLKYICDLKKMCDCTSMEDSKIVTATDKRMQERVVLKMASTKHDSNIFVMENEISIMKDISHPNCVCLIECFFLADNIIIEMEFCSRGTLSRFIRKGTVQFNEQNIASVVKEILNGLDYLHNERVIVHNDIKPDNILVDDQYEIKICDFGLSKKLIQKDQKRRVEIGTLAYMAPEQFTEPPCYGIEVDIWSLGIVIYEMANKMTPYRGVGKEKLASVVRDGPPPRLDPAKYSPDFCDFVSHCLEKEPQSRFTVTQLLEHPFIVKNATEHPSEFLRTKKTSPDEKTQDIDELTAEIPTFDD
jgi:serine/threonine protein kinase